MNYDSHPYKESKLILQIPEVRQFIEKLRAGKGNSNKNSKKSNVEELALKLMILWTNQPYTPLVELYPILGNLHYTVQIKIREFIEKKQWANFTEVRVGRSNMLFMELEPAGYNALNLLMPQDNIGRGKSEHRHYAHIIKRFAESEGYNAYLEWKIPNTTHPVDVAVDKNGQIEVYEISITANNLASHTEACFEKSDAVKKLIIVVSTKRKLKELKKQLKNNLMLARYKDKIQLDIIENYMERSKNESD